MRIQATLDTILVKIQRTMDELSYETTQVEISQERAVDWAKKVGAAVIDGSINSVPSALSMYAPSKRRYLKATDLGNGKIEVPFLGELDISEAKWKTGDGSLPCPDHGVVHSYTMRSESINGLAVTNTNGKGENN